MNQEQQAITQNQQVEQQQQAALNQEQGQIATLVKQQQEAEAAAAARAAAAKIAAAQAAASQAAAAQTAAANAAAAQQTTSTSSTSSTSSTTGNSGAGSSAPTGSNPPAPPPTSSGGEGAVQAAESQIGVPYVWGGESPRGSPDPGFDCSGLTAWSWGQVGVPLPHFSGAQMADSTPVPISDLEPGDLLFYGPGGDTHVAMYVGPGTMIEAPQTGETVWLTGLRLGDGFVGAGRP